MLSHAIAMAAGVRILCVDRRREGANDARQHLGLLAIERQVAGMDSEQCRNAGEQAGLGRAEFLTFR